MVVAIIDNGSQYTHLIKRTCRDLGYEADIINNTFSASADKILSRYERIIISGGPSSVYKKDLGLSGYIVNLIKSGADKPLFGICFGHQLIGKVFGGVVKKGKNAEYGISTVHVENEGRLLKNVPKTFKVWVSHYDEVSVIPNEFIRLAYSENCNIEAMEHKSRKIFSVQFHPEVWHTEYGETIMKNFLRV